MKIFRAIKDFFGLIYDAWTTPDVWDITEEEWNSNKMIKCPVCNGAKQQTFSVTKQVGRTRILTADTIPCALCKGRGEITNRDALLYNQSELNENNL